MSIIKTYRNLDFSAGSDYEATAENFPACAHFFPCTEIAGVDTILTDVIAGVKTTTLTSFTNPTTGAIKGTATLGSGNLVAPNTKAVVGLLVGQTALGAVSFGNIANGGFIFNGATIGMQIGGDAGIITAVNALTGGAVYGTGFKYEIGGNLTPFEMNDVGGYVEKAGTTVGATTTVPMDSVLSINVTNITSIFGIALFYFNILPTDVKQAIAWMTQEWRANNKQLYPAWKGRS